MKEKAMMIMGKMKDLCKKAIAAAPLPAGIAIGYIFHAEIQIVLSIAGSLIKAILHML